MRLSRSSSSPFPLSSNVFSIQRRAEALASADTRTLKRALYGETQTVQQFSQRRSVRLEADIPMVRLKPDTTYNRKPL